ncbi:transcription antitermination factor NusB [bacterium]|nr:transcription antitermination factor NusB [bacterium]
MKKKRRWARELTLKMLYALEVGDQSLNKGTFQEYFWNKEKNIPCSVKDYTQELVKGIEKNIQEIDKVISKHSKNWRIDRQSIINRNILRIGIYELIFCLDIPYVVCIDEAIELAKEYSDEDSPSFINGVLDVVRKDYHGCILGETSRLPGL